MYLSNIPLPTADYGDFQKHQLVTRRLQSVADMVMVNSEHDHKINTNLHTNIGIDDILDTLFKADHVILIWRNFVASFLHNFHCDNLVTSAIVVRYWND